MVSCLLFGTEWLILDVGGGEWYDECDCLINVTYSYKHELCQSWVSLWRIDRTKRCEMDSETYELQPTWSHFQLSGGDVLNITKTQYNKITKAKTLQRWNIDLKLSKSQIAKMLEESAQYRINLYQKSSDLSTPCSSDWDWAPYRVLYGAIEKAVSGDGAVRRVARKVRPRVRLRRMYLCKHCWPAYQHHSYWIRWVSVVEPVERAKDWCYPAPLAMETRDKDVKVSKQFTDRRGTRESWSRQL